MKYETGVPEQWRLFRGGSWNFSPLDARVAYCRRSTPFLRRRRIVGIRLARDPIHTLAREAATNE